MKGNSIFRRQHRERAFSTFESKRAARCLTKLQAFAKKQGKIEQMKSGAQLKMCQLWMQHSFSKVMEVVWRDFPRQELKKDPVSGHDLFVKNYLSLSKNPRRGLTFFYGSSRTYRRYLQS